MRATDGVRVRPMFMAHLIRRDAAGHEDEPWLVYMTETSYADEVRLLSATSFTQYCDALACAEEAVHRADMDKYGVAILSHDPGRTITLTK